MWTTATMITTLTTVLVILLLCVFHLDGGDAAPLSGKFKVHGLDIIRAGQMMSLNCFLEEIYTGAVTPPPSYEWVKDGKVIPGQTESIIRFPSATRQDAGFYQCGVPGSDVNGEGRYLHVVVPGDVLPKPDVEYIGLPVLGRPYSLRCIISQQYIPSDDTMYTWYKNNTEVRGQSGKTLTFTNVTEADAGEYTCTAREGPVETTSPPSNKLYLRPLVSPQVTIEPHSTEYVVKGILGGKLTLTCMVTRAYPLVPSDGYTWSYSPSSNAELQPLVERTNTLTLGPLTRKDSGQYVCQARNDQGLVSLNLIGHASVTVEVVYIESIALTSDREVNESDPVTLTCRVDSHPTARLTWTVNGQEVRHVTDNLDYYVIQSAACSDSNNYTCRASNTDMPGLVRNATVQLRVICKQATSKPHTAAEDVGTEVAVETDKMPWMTIAITLTGLLGVMVAAVVGLVLLWRRLPDAQRKGRLGKVVHCLFPPRHQKSRSHDSLDNKDDMKMRNVADHKSPFSGELSPLMGCDSGTAHTSSTPEQTALGREHVRKGRPPDDDMEETRRKPDVQSLLQQKSTEIGVSP